MARKRRKNALALPAGIITILLAIVGLITVINLSVNYAQKLKNREIKKAGYEDFLKPAVMFDPDLFDDLTQADNSQLLYAAVWNLLLDEEGMSKYPYSQGEHFGIQVPQEDIERSFRTLFGSEIDIASLHASIDMSAYDITYDAALKSYILPITGVDSVYIPRVYDIDRQGNSVVLTVGYIGTKAWADVEEGSLESPEPDKWMNITLRTQRDDTDAASDMYIASIQETDEQIKVKATTTVSYEEETETVTETETYIYEETTTETQYENVTDENGENVTQAVTQDESTSDNTEETTEAEN